MKGRREGYDPDKGRISISQLSAREKARLADRNAARPVVERFVEALLSNPVWLTYCMETSESDPADEIDIHTVKKAFEVVGWIDFECSPNGVSERVPF